MTVYSVNRLPNDLIHVIFATAKYKISTICYSPDLREKAAALRPNTKLTIYISLRSEENNGRWYHKIYLMHFEKRTTKPPVVKKDDNDLTSQRGLGFEPEQQ